MLIPEKVKLEVIGNKVKVTGPKGTLEVEYPVKEARIEVKGKEVNISCSKKIIANTVSAHLKNLMEGVISGYTKKLQTVYSHFPITIEVKEKKFIIKNFLGEKQPRWAKIIGSTKAEIKGQEITVSGINKEDVGQTIANLVRATKIPNRDSRVFQDGVYILEE